MWKIQPQWVVTPGKQTNKQTQIHNKRLTERMLFTFTLFFIYHGKFSTLPHLGE
jgi:hypothetical protein